MLNPYLKKIFETICSYINLINLYSDITCGKYTKVTVFITSPWIFVTETFVWSEMPDDVGLNWKYVTYNHTAFEWREYIYDQHCLMFHLRQCSNLLSSDRYGNCKLFLGEPTKNWKEISKLSRKISEIFFHNIDAI